MCVEHSDSKHDFLRSVVNSDFSIGLYSQAGRQSRASITGEYMRDFEAIHHLVGTWPRLVLAPDFQLRTKYSFSFSFFNIPTSVPLGAVCAKKMRKICSSAETEIKQ